MVQSNYTVSTAQQLLGRMPAVRVSGSKSKSRSAANDAGEHVKAAGQPSRGIAPTKPLPPSPLNTVRLRASCSSGVLAVTDKVKIRTDVPAVVTEGEILTLPAAVYTPTTPTAPRARSENVTLDSANRSTRVPGIGTPRKGRSSPGIEKRISHQYYEYITPPMSLTIGRTDSRRERKASHTPTSSTGSEIYFSPIDATRSQVFLSSPRPSPPISPSDPTFKDDEQAKLGEVVVKKVAELTIESASAREPDMVEIAGIGRTLDGRKVTLTLAHVDRITTALARAPLVQMRVRGSHLGELPENMTSPLPNVATDNANNTVTPTGLPTPPPSESEASTTDSTGGIALLNTTTTGAPITLTSTDAFTSCKCTHLSLSYGLSTTSALRIESAQIANAESKIILQSLFATFDRKTHARANLTLLAETDVTPSFAHAVLTELAAAQNLTLDDIEIRTPAAPYDPEESIDWCAIGREEEVRSPASDILQETLEAFASSYSSLTNAAATFSAETCTMQTLTLLSELARLQTAHATFLILQPTRFDAKGELAGVKIPLVSRKLQERFEKMGELSSSSSNSSSSAPSTSAASSSIHGGLKGRLFREAVIAAVAPRLGFGEEFETFVTIGKGKGRVRARCVPMFGREGVVERWVCFFGGEFDIPY
jgi:hypothetical protein